MALTRSHSSIQRLLEALPRGEIVETSTLAEYGVSPQLASYLAKRGWLQHLSRGVYLLVGDQPSRDGSLTYLARRIPGFHVGGKLRLPGEASSTTWLPASNWNYGATSRCSFLSG
jgi:hypothetical protein